MKPFKKLRAKMSAEGQNRARIRARRMLFLLRVATFVFYVIIWAVIGIGAYLIMFDPGVAPPRVQP